MSQVNSKIDNNVPNFVSSAINNVVGALNNANVVFPNGSLSITFIYAAITKGTGITRKSSPNSFVITLNSDMFGPGYEDDPLNSYTLQGSILHEINHAIYPNGQDSTPHTASWYLKLFSDADAAELDVDQSDINYLVMDLKKLGFSDDTINAELDTYKSVTKNRPDITKKSRGGSWLCRI